MQELTTEGELTKRVFSFHNDLEGFNFQSFKYNNLSRRIKRPAVLIGCEPTGHWFAFASGSKGSLGKDLHDNPFFS